MTRQHPHDKCKEAATKKVMMIGLSC